MILLIIIGEGYDNEDDGYNDHCDRWLIMTKMIDDAGVSAVITDTFNMLMIIMINDYDEFTLFISLINCIFIFQGQKIPWGQ